MDSDINTGTSDELTRVFVSYAREDAKWLDRDYRFNLVPFLMESLKRQNVVFWFDKDLKPGDEFRRQIEAKIDQSQIALLIVSQAFLNSDFIERHEMSRIAERARLGQTIIVPLLVEPCDWSEYPILADRQMVPGSTPLIDYTESDSKWARVKAEILDGFKTQVKRIRAAQAFARSQREQEDLAGEKARREADGQKGPVAPAPPETEQEGLAAGPVAGAVTAEGAPAEEETAARPEPDEEEQKRGLKRIPVWAWGALAVLALVAALAAVFVAGRTSGPQLSTAEAEQQADSLLRQEQYSEARPLFQKACSGGDMDGCYQLGLLYELGKGVTEDYAKARTLYQKACDGGDMDGCYELGLLSDLGKGATQDAAKARTLYQKACDGGNLHACVSLGLLNEIGDGGTQDYAQARTLYQKACDGGEMSGCDYLGTLYVFGKGVTPDNAQARTLFQKACNVGDQWACERLKSLP